LGYAAGNPVNRADRSGLYWCGERQWCEEYIVDGDGDLFTLPLGYDLPGFLTDASDDRQAQKDQRESHKNRNKCPPEICPPKETPAPTPGTTPTTGDPDEPSQIPTCQGPECPRFKVLLASGAAPGKGPARTGPIGALQDLWNNYWNMREAWTIGADGYFHCMAQCQAARRGRGGAFTAGLVGELREMIDQHVFGDPEWACDEDRVANDIGREGDQNLPCETVCSVFRPPWLDPKY
jgi:hypothetical protein